MNLWKLEIIHLFRSWRGWTLLAFYLLASVLAIVIGYFIERATGQFSYARALDLYMIASIVGGLLFVGLVVSALAFDSNKDSSVFLRTRFSMKQILLTKLLVYFPLSYVLFFGGLLYALGKLPIWAPEWTQAFEIKAGYINYFGQAFELDAHFRKKPLISAAVVSPLLALFAWRRFSRREI